MFIVVELVGDTNNGAPYNSSSQSLVSLQKKYFGEEKKIYS